MRSNTAEIGNQAVSFSDFHVEKDIYKSDPFTVRDGHYVGHDGFVVPKDFTEFIGRFPDYVQRWVSKHASTSASPEDVEDRTQDLLLHLSSLPQTSRYREAGKADIVATFDPLKHHGANEARFRSYINLCLTNKFRTMYCKRRKDALGRVGNFSLDGQRAGEDLCDLDELCRKHSMHFQTAEKASEKQSADKIFLQEFLSFVGREDAEALPAIQAVMATGTRCQAAYWLGIAELEFDRMHTRVKHLGRCFVSGEAVPKQRKRYKRHREPSTCGLVA
jgi:hypothetical protein